MPTLTRSAFSGRSGPAGNCWRKELAPSHRVDMDAREGLSPPCRGLRPRASILGHRAMAAREGIEPPPSG